MNIARLVPITRIADVTPLDPLGLPAFAAVTPLATDLTSHMGKGHDRAAARVSALMEAVERITAEGPVPGETRRSSFATLASESVDHVIDPADLTLPGDTRYEPDRVITWVRSHDLIADEAVWMASDLVTSPPTEGVLLEVDTNGLAAGNTLLEATVHAVCEVIERDTWSQHEFVTQFGNERTSTPEVRRIDADTLPPDSLDWVERIREHGLGLVLHDLTSDVGIATVLAILTDRDYVSPAGPRPMHFQGLGAHPDAGTAVFRSISEAVQGRLSVIQGARDDYNTMAASPRAFTTARRLEHVTPRDGIAFSDLPTYRSDDIADDLRHVIGRLRDAGFARLVVTDLTRSDLGIPVVRVRVPGLSCFVVNRRRVDWRCLRHLL